MPCAVGAFNNNTTNKNRNKNTTQIHQLHGNCHHHLHKLNHKHDDYQYAHYATTTTSMTKKKLDAYKVKVIGACVLTRYTVPYEPRPSCLPSL